MRMHEKKLRKFNLYGKIANVLFVLIVVFGSILVAAALGGAIYLTATDFDFAKIVNFISINTVPDLGLLLPEGITLAFSTLLIIIIHLALGIAIAAYITKSVSNIFRNTVKDQTPFTEKTVRCLKSIGVAFLVYAGILFVLSMLVGVVTPHLEPSTFNVSIDGQTILLGLLILSLGEIFEFGMNLQQDTESIV